jgi:hypothetical protein
MKTMMKAKMIQEKNVALWVIPLLSLSILTGYTFPNRANANFVFPPSDPVITFESPINKTYSTNNISLKVEFYTYKTGYYGAPEEESLRQFQYSLDGTDFQSIKITNYSIGRNPGTDVYFDGLIELHQLSEGEHNLTVKVIFDYSDLNSPYNTIGDTSEHYRYHTESTSDVYLIVAKSSENSQPSPSVPEFSWLTILPLLLATPIVLITARKRLQGDV